MIEVAARIRLIAEMYARVFVKTCSQLVSSWKVVLYQVLLLLALGVVFIVSSPLGIIGGFIRGLSLVLAVTVYFVTIRCVLKKEAVDIEVISHDARALFSVILNIFFALFLCQLILSALNNPFLLLAFGVLLAVVGNPIPEISYLEGGSLGEILGRSVEFMQENFLEWILPFILVIGCLYGFTVVGIVEGFTAPPIYRIRELLGALAGSMLSPLGIVFGILVLYLALAFFLFRGNLFLELQVGRRARAYKASSQ